MKINAAIEYQQVFTDSYSLRDRLIQIGSGTKKTPSVTLRLIEIRKGKIWHSYGAFWVRRFLPICEAYPLGKAALSNFSSRPRNITSLCSH